MIRTPDELDKLNRFNDAFNCLVDATANLEVKCKLLNDAKTADSKAFNAKATAEINFDLAKNTLLACRTAKAKRLHLENLENQDD